MSSEGGERRLNVLFTRAKRQCRVFASIRHGDIRLDTTKHRGPRVLKRFLKYAETGELDVPVLTGGEPDSPFESAVARAVESHGYRVAGQVGSAGFLIDLAVYDPDDDGRFLLAIECDGARYHSSSWARERDRLRQAVLEGKGWRFHRIWSTDWFYNRDAELERLLEGIERARTGPATEARPRAAQPETVVVREESPAAGDKSQAPRPRYVEASFAVPGYIPIHEADTATLEQCVTSVVEVEGPVHRGEIVRRVSQLWGYKRLGSRIRAAAAAGIEQAVRSKKIRRASADSDQFFDMHGAPEHPESVRDRRGSSASVRDPRVLPPTEIRAGIMQAVEASISVSPSECATDVARMFGYGSTTARIRKRFEVEAAWLVSQGRLAEVDGELRLP